MKTLEKVKNIIEKFEKSAFMIEVRYAASRHNSQNKTELVYSDYYGVADCVKPGIDPLEMDAIRYELMDEYSYTHDIDCDGGYAFDEEREANPENEDPRILVIFISKLAYRILTDPEVKPVRDYRLAQLGEYHECLVVKRPMPQLKNEDSESAWDGYDGADYGEEDYDEPRTSIKVVPGDKMRLDKFYADECVLVGEDEFLQYDIECYDSDRAWWEEESFEEHFGTSDAKVLLIFLA